MKHIFSLLLFVLAALTAAAQERPVTASWMVAGGYTRLADAYLAPFSTSGAGFSLGYERAQALASRPGSWSRRLALELDLDHTHTRSTAGSGIIWGAAFEAGMGALWRPAPLPCGLSLAIGPGLFLSARADYRPSNGNNPVGAHAGATIGAMGRAAYPLRLGRVAVDLSLSPSLQLLGAFFSPAYGQLYYEIYEGPHGGLVHFAWPGSRIALSSLLAADIRLGATSLRLGYALRLSTEEAGGLAFNLARHSLVVGITQSFISIDPRRSPSTQLRYAF